MEYLVIAGAITALLGLFGLGYCIWEGFRLRRSKQDLKALTPHLQKLIAINFGSLGLSVLGLMMVVIGILA